MKTINILGKECTLKVNNYADEPLCMAIQSYTLDGEPWATLTIGADPEYAPYSLVQKGCAFIKNYSENTGVLDDLLDSYLGVPYIKFGQPVILDYGFVSIPLIQFDLKKLAEFDKEGTEKYISTYEKAFKEWQDQKNTEMFETTPELDNF